jgi:hypothetical protein
MMGEDSKGARHEWVISGSAVSHVGVGGVLRRAERRVERVERCDLRAAVGARAWVEQTEKKEYE